MASYTSAKRTVVSTKPVQPDKHFSFSVLRPAYGTKPHQSRLLLSNQRRCRGDRWRGDQELRNSLSELLTNFPVMTGRLQKNGEGHWMINCNDAGVRIVEARAIGRVEEWLRCTDNEKELKLVHGE